MKPSLVLETTARFLEPLLLLFSVFLLLAGHNEPGGGFSGGLVAAAAFSLHALAFGVASARRALWIAPARLIAAGLLLAAGSGLAAAMRGAPVFTGLWATVTFGDTPLKVGTPLVFDAGVYCVVVGVVMMFLFAMSEEADADTDGRPGR